MRIVATHTMDRYCLHLVTKRNTRINYVSGFYSCCGPNGSLLQMLVYPQIKRTIQRQLDNSISHKATRAATRPLPLYHKVDAEAEQLSRSFQQNSSRCLKFLVDAIAMVQLGSVPRTAKHFHMHPHFPMFPKPLFELWIVAGVVVLFMAQTTGQVFLIYTCWKTEK